MEPHATLRAPRRQDVEQAAAQRPGTLPARDIEQLVGRLIFAAGVTQRPLAEYYLAMKWSKRICNALNRHDKSPTDQVAVPPSVREQLQAWLTHARDTVTPRFERDGARPVLFVDATLDDWGGVLVLPTRRVIVTGAKFTDGVSAPIHIREAQAALFSIQDFALHLRGQPGVDLRVDNTSVEASVRRGSARNELLATVIRRIMRASIQLDLPIAVSRVASEENPADEISRNLTLDEAKLADALAMRVPTYARRGAGRPFARAHPIV